MHAYTGAAKCKVTDDAFVSVGMFLPYFPLFLSKYMVDSDIVI